MEIFYFTVNLLNVSLKHIWYDPPSSCQFCSIDCCKRNTCFVILILYCHVIVTIDVCWSVNRICSTLITRNYKWGLCSHWSTHFTNHYKTHWIFSVKFSTSLCLVTAVEGERSPSSGFQSCPLPQLKTTESHQSPNALIQSQSCGLPPISSSWRQAPWDRGPNIFFSTELLR
jgi:hypothetical protein